MVYWYPNAKKWARIRQEVLIRDQNKCQKCGRTTSLEVHHIVPRVKGGSHELTNLITYCPSCHAKAEGSTNESGIKLKCPRVSCGWTWIYAGKSTIRTSCPQCKTAVMIEKNTVREEKE